MYYFQFYCRKSIKIGENKNDWNNFFHPFQPLSSRFLLLLLNIQLSGVCNIMIVLGEVWKEESGTDSIFLGGGGGGWRAK